MKKYPMTIAIVSICVALQLAQTIHPSLIDYQVFSMAYLRDIHLIGEFFTTLILHMFSHAGWEHLIGNMSIGIPCLAYLEHRLGGRAMLNFFVACGLAAAATQIAMPLTGLGGMIGASGAIFGCLAGSCMLFAESTHSRLIGVAFLALWLVPQLGALSLSMVSQGVAFGAHIGGAIAGIILASFEKK